jgi:RimJ/RimL family protein N-acetyltransferase
MTLSEEVRSGHYVSASDATAAVMATERLILRAPRLADAAVVAALANDRRIAENTARIPHPYTLADAESFIAAVAGPGSRETVFAVTLADGDLLGMCGVGGREAVEPELGYWFGAPYWGQGYATESVRAVVDYAFSDVGHDVLHAGAHVNNPASRRVLEKCGFQWTGVRLQRVRALASSVPVDQFRLKRRGWAELKNLGPTPRVV